MCVRGEGRFPETAATNLINNCNFWKNKMSGGVVYIGVDDGGDGGVCVCVCPIM